MFNSSTNQHPTTYQQFLKSFAYKDKRLYRTVFERHPDKIKLSREKFAVNNLEKIFGATFQLVPKIGFQAMSLRDLSAETGLSMGGLYSSISYKENIAIMVKDLVALVCSELVDKANAEENAQLALEQVIRGYLYTSTALQAWFYFLYFETRSLPLLEQEASKNLELEQVAAMRLLLDKIRHEKSPSVSSEDIATMMLAMIQERYLKPWKYKHPEKTIDDYVEHCLTLLHRLL